MSPTPLSPLSFGITFLLFIAPVIYLRTSDYIGNKDERIQNAIKARTNIEKTSDTKVSCNGNGVYFQESRWGASVVLLKPVEDEIKPVFLAIYNVHEADKSCEIREYPRHISTARTLVEQCSKAGQDLQTMLERFEKLQCPHDK